MGDDACARLLSRVSRRGTRPPPRDVTTHRRRQSFVRTDGDGSTRVRRRQVARGAVELAARREIAAGDPVTLDYGALTNDHFLLDYGFVPTTESGDGNPHDVAALRWDLGLLDAAREVAGLAAAPFGSRGVVGGGGDVVAGRAVRAVAGGRASSIGPGRDLRERLARNFS